MSRPSRRLAGITARVAFPVREPRRISASERYAVALICAGLALTGHLALRTLAGANFFPIFLAAVALGAWYGGLWPGLLTVGSSSVGLLVLPRLSSVPPQVASPPDAGSLAMFVASGAVLAWLIAFLLGARRRAERAAARTERVHALNLSLGPALTLPEVARIIVQHAIEALRAQAAAIVLFHGDGATLEVVHADGNSGAEEAAGAARRSAELGPLAHAARLREAVFLESAAGLAGPNGGGGSLAALPFVPNGQPLGAIELRFAHPRRFPRDDRNFMLTLVGQGAQALERARLYEAERSARHRAEEAGERVAFLAEASEVLASSLDYRATLPAVARLAVPRLADWCAVDVIETDGRLKRLAIAHGDPKKVDAAWDLSRRYPASVRDPVPRTVRAGQPQLVAVVSAEQLQDFARDPEHLERLRRLGLCSLLTVPLCARDRTLGAITLAMAESGRHYSEADLPLAEDLARRAATAVDNARLYFEAETALHGKSEILALLDTVFSGAPIGLAFVDRALRFVRINTELATLNGRSSEDHIGRTLAEVLGPRAALVEPLFRRVFESGEPVLEHEIRAEFPGIPGQATVVLASYYPVRSEEGEVHWVGAIVQDVTERKRADEMLIQAQRMEAVAKVAGGVAHEVNNMMTVIAGFSGFLQGSLPSGDPRLLDLAEIRKAAERAAGITRQLLAYSRQQVLQPQPLDLTQLIRGMSVVLQRLLGQSVRLNLRLEPGLRPVQADWAQLEQVFVNLTLNARDAMRASGELSIETRNVALDEGYTQRYPGVHVPGGRYVQVTISDTGHGMDPGTRARVFEPFFTTKRLGEGTGLGLATVYGIIKQSGGFIWVYSEPGEGSVFKIYLPEEVDAGEANSEPEIVSAPPSGSETILLVEDEEAVRRMAARVLASKGYTVLEAGNGADAIDLVRRRPGTIDLVVTDVIMPVLGGRGLGEQLAQVRPDLPVLFISGYTDDDVIRRGLLAPDSPFLQKPFESDSLARKVREVLEA